jgi:ketosteroid isomerase-like protein
MSQDNVNLVRQSYEAFARGDIEAVLATMDVQVVWRDPETLPYGGARSGHDGVAEHIQSFVGYHDEVAVEPERFLDAGDQVIVTGRLSGRGKGGGGRFDAPFAHFWSLRDGRATAIETYTDTAQIAQALSA